MPINFKDKFKKVGEGMKIHKKEVAVLLVFALFLGCLFCPARIRAEEGTNEETETEIETVRQGKIEMSHTNLSSMQAGTVFNVQIHIHDMDSFAGLTGTFTYDRNMLETAVTTGSAIAVAPKTMTTSANRSTLKWIASLTPTASADTLEVKWDGSPAPSAADMKLKENDGLVVTIPFRLKQDSASQQLPVTLTNVTVFTDIEDTTKNYVMHEENIKQLTIEAQKLEFEFGTSEGCEEIKIPLKIKENTGVSGFTIEISCDKEEDSGALKFYMSKQTFADSAKGKFSIKNHTWTGKALTLEFITTGMIQEKEPHKGEFLTLVLDAVSSVTANRDIPVTLTVKQVRYKENTVPFITKGANTTLTIKPLNYKLGHVKNTGSTEISLLDAVWVIREYQNQNIKEPLTEAQRKAADVDGDGIIGLQDALWILECFNGERDENFNKITPAR